MEWKPRYIYEPLYEGENGWEAPICLYLFTLG